jgi:hypothetical protein
MWKQEREKKMFIGVRRHEGGLFIAKRLAKSKIERNNGILAKASCIRLG